MKFTDGFWVVKKGVRIFSAVQVRDAVTDRDSVTLYAAPFRVENRGQTLGGPLLTIRVTSPLPDILRIQALHFAGSVQKGPAFTLNGSRQPLETEETEGSVRIRSGRLTAQITKDPFSIRYSYNGRALTRSGPNQLAYITAPQGAFFREQLDLGVGENIYGLGERFTPFVKNGQTVDLWNEDGGTSSDIAYKNIPFYLSGKGYGVFVNDPGRVSCEIASEAVSRVQFSVPGEALDYLMIGGGSPKGVLQNYTALTGRPALPPAWSFGLWLTTSFTTQYDEKTVTSFVDGMAERNLPLRVFHFDCFWMKEYEWCNFEWDKNAFSDVKGMLTRLKQKGLKICVWINPYIAQKSVLFDEGMRGGYLLKRPDGSVWQWDMWQPGMAVVDFTNPAARDWYGAKLQNLIDLGADCFKTDFGERIPTDAVYFDGSDPVRMHNYYPYLYNRTVFELLKKNFGKNNAVVFARSATAGCQQFPVHWGGDCQATYASMAESLRGGLSLCLSGFGFWSHDISGFENTATPDLYKRWTAFGLLSTHSRLHGSGSYRVPWLFDEEAVDVLRFFTNLKCTLMPYLYSAACEAARDGVPAMRAMLLEFPGDPACAALDRQYMLGGSLLVAPVFSETGEVEYYLPEGSWTRFLTNETVEGGRWMRETHNYFSLPFFARPNSIVAVGNNDRVPDYDYSQDLTLHIFALSDSASADLHNQDGTPMLKVSARNENGRVRILLDGKTKGLRILMRGVNSVAGLSGAAASADRFGTLLTVEAGAEEVAFTL